MAKKQKQKPPAPDQGAATAKPELSERERAQRVLASQGRAIGLLDSLPAAMQLKLAEFASPSGEVSPKAVAGVRTLFQNYYADMKAVVDE